jgi:2-polyprenyl-6-methoxyphenol hydroxylase-like FAD-dependent oxidoreductase
VTRYGAHAVVLGASMAGLVHAVPLAERFERVTLVDRDRLPDRAEHRRGVPQDDHIHLLVPGGLTRLEGLLPGVLGDMAARGAHVIEAPEWRFYMGGARLDLRDRGLRITGATRPLIESVVRDRVLALDGVELLDGWNARELTTTPDRGRVTGVRLRSSADPQEHRTLAADLVVDTMGRGSPSPRWLDELGYPAPEEQRLKVDVHYTTRLFHRDPTDLEGCGNVLVDIPPDGRRGGFALAVEDGRWLVSLVGLLGERAPSDLDGFTDYAASLWTADLHEIVEGAVPVSEPATHSFPAFSWHRYDRLQRLPERYLVSGDAVCSFDPRLGQGMTVAITEATELDRVLDRHGLSSVGERLLSAVLPTVQDAWELATGTDLANPDVDGPRPLAWRLTNAYMQRLLPAAHHDPVVAEAFIRVVGMLDRPQALMHPRILRRVLGRARRADAEGAGTRIGSRARVRSE